MSIQISPWSTHEKPFKMNLKKKLARLSPIRKQQRKQFSQKKDKQKHEDKSYENLNVQSNLEITFEKEDRMDDLQKDEKESNEQYLNPEFRRYNQRISRNLEENTVLKLIREKLFQQENISLMFPLIKHKKQNSQNLEIKNFHFKNNTIDLGRPAKQKRTVKNQNLKTPKCKNSRVKVMNYNPFDDRQIMERGLAVFRNGKQRMRKNYSNFSVRIKAN